MAKINKPHLVLKCEITLRTGQCSMSLYFFSISCIFFTLIFNISNPKVTEYRLCNLCKAGFYILTLRYQKDIGLPMQS